MPAKKAASEVRIFQSYISDLVLFKHSTGLLALLIYNIIMS